MNSINSLLLTVFLSLFVFQLKAQNYQWAIKAGGTQDDISRCIYADNNGSVYITGYFKGNNIDFDPGAGSAFLSSNGNKDIFVAKYTSTGQYAWAFKIGGAGLDEAQAISVDINGNVYITGYFRGTNVDFDPGLGTAILSSNGQSGGDPGYGGDVFIAKYNSSGQYQWAFNIGGTSLDNGMVIATDAQGNIFTSGYFRETPDFDPGSGTATLNAATGTIYVAKYNTNGQYQWCFNLGEGDTDNSPFGLKVDANSNLYLTGFFQGTNRDFDPGTGTAYLSSNGSFDVFVAKYNSNGQFQWALPIGGGSVDVGRDIEVDNLGNVYVAGDFDGSIDFDPSPSGSAILSSNNRDVFVAKYNTNGQYVWAKRFGASGSDISWSIAYTQNNIYITGSYQGTINFSPSGTDNLNSNGQNDFFVTKFDINGNYICAFGVGGISDDDGYRIDADASGNLYITGMFSSSSADFNPSSAVTNNLSTAGSSDIFLVKYQWPDNSPASGTLTGNNTVCTNGQGQLTFNAITGSGPFTIQYSDGNTTFTQSNVTSGVPFNLNPSPIVTTNYNLVSVRGSERCASVNYPSGINAIVTVGSNINADFNYSQNPCNPKIIQFSNLTPGTTSLSWNFGNNQTNTGSQNPSVTYTNYGSYPVKLKVQTSSGCVDSITKIIPVNVLQDSMINNNDTTICRGTSVQLKTNPSLNFCWANTAGLSNSNISNPIATPTNTTTYYFTSQSIAGNLIVNGDFTGGNTGFQSDYTQQTPPNTVEGVYWVNTNSFAWNSNFNSCGDHTTGSGNMMMVNGSAVVGAKVWSQTIAVTPNTNYAFSVWIQSLAALNPANLRFAINGNVLGTNINAGNIACQWSQFFATWNSGTANSAIITIINNNTIATGNDFAIDDISFAPVLLKQDSIKITVSDPPTLTVTPSSSICPGDTIPLNVSGAGNYLWTPTQTLINAATASPSVFPTATTKYYVSGYNVIGCTSRDSVTVTVKSKPSITKSSDTAVCTGYSSVQLLANATGALQYTWSPAAGLNNAAINNPSANPGNTTTYYVEVLGGNDCKAKDSIKVSVLQSPTIDTRSDTAICNNSQTILTTSASNATSFSWSPNAGLSDPNIQNPIASPSVLTKYIITASNAACSAKDSVIIDVLPAPTISKSNDTTICNEGAASLFASGGNNYLWSPASGLSSTNISNPIASPSAPTTYKVQVTGINGCTKLDSVRVNWIPKPAFTINPVTVSVCSGSATTLTANGADTYNWFAGSNVQSPSAASTSVAPTSTQQYSVAVRHNFCKISDTLHSTVTVNTLPIITVAKSNDIDCSNASATLNATGGVSYNWAPVQGVSAANSATPVVTPAATTTYTVTVTDVNGCTKSDSVKVNVIFNPLAGGYNMPNAFTPNGDGKNDCFGIKYWGAIETLDFTIFNRWGEVVFKTSNPAACWDGSFKGIPQASGTFVYQIKAKTACGEVYKKGTITLMR